MFHSQEIWIGAWESKTTVGEPFGEATQRTRLQPPGLCPSPKLRSLIYLVNTFPLLALSPWAPSSTKPSLTPHPRDTPLPPLDHPSREAVPHISTSVPGAFTVTSTHKAASPQGWELPEGGTGSDCSLSPQYQLQDPAWHIVGA